LIDDDRAWLETLTDFLQSRGFEVQAAQRPAQALALMSDGVALAVVDYHLPEMDGLQFVERLRGRQPNAVILMISGDDDPTLAARALARGAQAFISKTTSPGLLLRTLHEFLTRHEAARPVPSARRCLPVLLPACGYLPVPA
jgi:DNA-binding response OmpR family regulator